MLKHLISSASCKANIGIVILSCRLINDRNHATLAISILVFDVLRLRHLINASARVIHIGTQELQVIYLR